MKHNIRQYFSEFEDDIFVNNHKLIKILFNKTTK